MWLPPPGTTSGEMNQVIDGAMSITWNHRQVGTARPVLLLEDTQNNL